MWRQAGVYRTQAGLTSAALTLAGPVEHLARQRAAGASLSPQSWRSVSLLTVASLIVQAAGRREESRGAHSRTDHPDRDDLHWKRRVFDHRMAR
jgi:L-aspartate oxidase